MLTSSRVFGNNTLLIASFELLDPFVYFFPTSFVVWKRTAALVTR